MNEVTDVTVREESTFDLARTDGMGALKRAEEVVRYMADKCAGQQFVSNIQGKKYPRVEWWTTVGAAFGLFPQEVSSKRLERDGEVVYEGVVEVQQGGRVVSRASAICSSNEKTWSKRDEYAVKSMATTRATGKAYRIAFSFLAVMAGLEPTPAEEMPHEAEEERKFYTCPKCGKAAVIKGKQEYGGGYVCWKKEGGCGSKFGENDPQITAQDLPTEPGPGEVDDCLKLELDLNDLLITADGRLMHSDIETLRAGMAKHKGNLAWFAKAIAATEAKLKEQEALLAANVEGSQTKTEAKEVAR